MTMGSTCALKGSVVNFLVIWICLLSLIVIDGYKFSGVMILCNFEPNVKFSGKNYVRDIDVRTLRSTTTKPPNYDVELGQSAKNPITQAERLVSMKVTFKPSGNQINFAVSLRNFWNTKHYCLKTFEDNDTLKSLDYAFNSSLPCLKLLDDVHNDMIERCIHAKFYFDVKSLRFIKDYAPLMSLPILTLPAGKKVLSYGDEITCSSRDRSIQPPPSFQILLNDKNDPGLDMFDSDPDKVVLYVSNQAKNGDFSISCIAANTMGNSIFAYKVTKTITIRAPPKRLNITPWERTIFYENSIIKCEVEGNTEGCEWYKVHGGSTLITQSNNDSTCTLFIKTDGESLLQGGMYEWVCHAKGLQNRRYLFQRKLFYIFVPLKIRPFCLECATTAIANNGIKREYTCASGDDNNYPQSSLEWQYISGPNDTIYISGKILQLIESEEIAEEQTVVAVCVATDILYGKRNVVKWQKLTSKRYYFKRKTLLCPVAYKMIVKCFQVIITMSLFVLADLILLDFIRQLRNSR